MARDTILSAARIHRKQHCTCDPSLAGFPISIVFSKMLAQPVGHSSKIPRHTPAGSSDGRVRPVP
jgi:hypothetical protein